MSACAATPFTSISMKSNRNEETTVHDSADTLAFGLIGYPLGHSFSPEYFKKRFKELDKKATYEAYPLSDINDLPELIHEKRLRGFNVTIPYKQAILPFLKKLSPEANIIKAVNCVNVEEGMKGYNTDSTAFLQTLMPLIKPYYEDALILGTGGAALAVSFALRQLQIPYKMVSRTPVEGVLGYDELTEEVMQRNNIIVNATPIGMYPQVDQCPPIPYKLLTRCHLVYDLVYNPDKTLFLKKAEAQGALIKNGLEMLYVQAEISLQIWDDKRHPFHPVQVF